MTDYVVEFHGPFGTHMIPIDRVDVSKLVKLKEFYDTPEGRELLKQALEDEESFRSYMREYAGVDLPVRIEVNEDVRADVLDAQTMEIVGTDVLEGEDESN